MTVDTLDLRMLVEKANHFAGGRKGRPCRQFRENRPKEGQVLRIVERPAQVVARPIACQVGADEAGTRAKPRGDVFAAMGVLGVLRREFERSERESLTVKAVRPG